MKRQVITIQEDMIIYAPHHGEVWMTVWEIAELLNVTEVYKIDNGPDYVSDGLFRIVGKNSKIGFADTCGAIVIPPVFSYATPFHNGEAKVSFGGKNEKQGEYQSWKSNLWFLIKKSK